MENDITIVVTTFERRKLLNRCLDSINKYYPHLPVIVADNSKYPICESRFDNVDIVHLPYDCGASLARNLALTAVKTPYVLMLEDDTYFDASVDLELMLGIAKEGNDIVGCMLDDTSNERRDGYFYQGNFNESVDVEGVSMIALEPLTVQDKSELRYIDYINCDVTSQCILFNKDKVIDAGGWLNCLRVHEHFEFFWRMKKDGLKTALTYRSQIVHDHIQSPYYDIRRNSCTHNCVQYIKNDLKLIFDLSKIEGIKLIGDNK